MTMLGFEDLVKSPPLNSKGITLQDSREVRLFELPVSVMNLVQRISKESESDVDNVMDSITRVAGHALLGREPQEKELDTIRKTFGASSVMLIYYQALKFSRLGPDALDDTKKP